MQILRGENTLTGSGNSMKLTEAKAEIKGRGREAAFLGDGQAGCMSLERWCTVGPKDRNSENSILVISFINFCQNECIAFM